jgi:phosphotransferase system  glucose/maltose/N-acetylglucosamine-specific IIC component
MEQRFSTISKILLSTGAILCVWVTAAVITALSDMNWSVSQLAGHYMAATGMIKPLHTLVDFYTHIKGIEYLICVAFFVAFPVFYRYLNKEQKKRPARR